MSEIVRNNLERDLDAKVGFMYHTNFIDETVIVINAKRHDWVAGSLTITQQMLDEAEKGKEWYWMMKDTINRNLDRLEAEYAKK